MLMFINETNGMHKRNYSFRMDIVEKVFKVISCIKIFVNDIKIYTLHYNYNHFMALWSMFGTTGWASTRRYISPSSGFSGAK